MLHLLEQGEVGLTVDALGSQGQGAAGLAVEGVGGGDEPLALALEAGQLHGDLHGLGARVGEEALLQVAGGAGGHGLGQVAAQGVDELLGVQALAAQLCLDGVDDELLAVAGHIDAEAAHGVPELLVIIQPPEVRAAVFPFQHGVALGLGGDALSVVDPAGADVGVEVLHGLLDHLGLLCLGDLIGLHVDELDHAVEILDDLLSVFFVVVHNDPPY